MSQHSQMVKGDCVMLTPGGPVGRRMVRPEPRKMSKRETGSSADFEPAIMVPRDSDPGIVGARRVCADAR